jgi:LPXTG-site transpeptidase (sortase) family protein
MPQRPSVHLRRGVAAALTIVALALFAVAGTKALAVYDAPRDTSDQRVLPPPSPKTVRAEFRRLELPAKRPRARKQMPTPARIEIPAIGVSAPIVPLGLNPDHTLQVPRRFADAGWFVDGPEPGEAGAAVIAGHVDSRTGPAVFYRLRALRPGDRIRIRLRTGASVAFVVQNTRHVSKRRFPVNQVYQRTKRPTLRLITCDGRFDHATHHYVDNYIVFAAFAS